MSKPKKKPIRTRDYLMVGLILGKTKSGVQPDQKKEAARKACRKGKQASGEE